MPDPERKTVSGTQAPAILGLSPYATPWSVYQQLRTGAGLSDPEPNIRMRIGKLLQPVILRLAAEEMRLDVVENAEDAYTRHPALPVGATVDGRVVSPSRGPGIVQAKAVAADQSHLWRNRRAPPHVEIQIQTEMLAAQVEWGIIAALVGGSELQLLERQPSPLWTDRIATAAADMMRRVREGDAPDAFGRECEYDLLRDLWPDLAEEKVVHREDAELLRDCDDFLRHSEAKLLADERRQAARVRLLVAMEDAEAMMLPGYAVRQRRSRAGATTLVVKEMAR